MSKEINQQGLLKAIGIMFLGIIALGLVYNMFFQLGPNLQGSSGMMMHGGMGAQGGFSLTGLIAGILVIFIKILSVFLVLGLIVGLAIVLKKFILEDANLSSLMGTSAKVNCNNCGNGVKGNWDFCPYCGEAMRKIGEK